mmetsp:Transcript_4649/g.17755  ORF Transcript_4649/g.17755 Transcript_4649/m.17755 type:complete len:217 (+) Transcript_4649:450-1100(+)
MEGKHKVWCRVPHHRCAHGTETVERGRDVAILERRRVAGLRQSHRSAPRRSLWRGLDGRLELARRGEEVVRVRWDRAEDGDQVEDELGRVARQARRRSVFRKTRRAVGARATRSGTIRSHDGGFDSRQPIRGVRGGARGDVPSRRRLGVSTRQGAERSGASRRRHHRSFERGSGEQRACVLAVEQNRRRCTCSARTIDDYGRVEHASRRGRDANQG